MKEVHGIKIGDAFDFKLLYISSPDKSLISPYCFVVNIPFLTLSTFITFPNGFDLSILNLSGGFPICNFPFPSSLISFPNGLDLSIFNLSGGFPICNFPFPSSLVNFPNGFDLSILNLAGDFPICNLGFFSASPFPFSFF